MLLKQILSPEWKHGTKVLIATILISISLIVFYHLNKGLVISPDFKDYSRSVDNLINLNFNFYKYYINSENNYSLSFFYTLTVFLLAFLKVVSGTAWLNYFVSLNLVLIFFSLIIYSKILLMLKIRPIVVSLAIPIITLSVDILVWPRYILSDTIFAFEIMLVLYLITKGIIKEKFDYFTIIVFLLFILITRPTSIPFIFIFAIFIAATKIKIIFNPKLIFFIIISLLIFIPLIFGICFKLMNTYLSNVPKVIFLVDMVEAGMIIHDRPETWIKSPDKFTEYVYLYFLRMVSFFNPYALSFSIIHLILNFFQTLIIIFSIFIWMKFGKEYYVINKVITLILLISIFVAAFHSYILIDYDWRYRFPIVMPLLIIFPVAIEILLKNLKINSKY